MDREKLSEHTNSEEKDKNEKHLRDNILELRALVLRRTAVRLGLAAEEGKVKEFVKIFGDSQVLRRIEADNSWRKRLTRLFKFR